MTAEEFMKFAATLKTLYPREKMLETPVAMELWLECLGDISIDAALAGLKRWVLTNKWAPAISDIRQMTVANKNGTLPDWGESWKNMKRQISRWGYMREDKALECMDPITKEVVQRLGFQSICQSEDEEVLRGQFRRIHDDVAKRRMEEAQLTDDVKKLMDVSMPKLEEVREAKDEYQAKPVSAEWKAKVAAIREGRDD